MKKEQKLFPIDFNGEKYYKKDCSDLFLMLYTCKEALCYGCKVYLSDGLYVYPDGSVK